jgi:hypothetical protein
MEPSLLQFAVGFVVNYKHSSDYAADKQEAESQIPLTDGMRRPVSRRDAVRCQVIDVL